MLHPAEFWIPQSPNCPLSVGLLIRIKDSSSDAEV
jgi:hypothetical protein